MSTTIPRRPDNRHLAVADDVHEAVEAVQQSIAEVTRLTAAASRPPKPVLRPLARLDVEQARKFLMDIDAVAASTSPLLAMFLLGRCAEHAQALLDVIDATVTP